MQLTIMTSGGPIETVGVNETHAAEFMDAYRSFSEGNPQTQYEFSFPHNVKLMISFPCVLAVKFQ